MGSYGELFDQSRQVVLEALADAIENYHDRKSTLEKAEPKTSREHAPQEGDFLYDFLRLNVQYLNQFARLGSNYSIVASRALETLYGYCIPKEQRVPQRSRPDATHALHIDVEVMKGRAGETVTAPIAITNRSTRQVRFHISVSECWVRVGDDGAADSNEPVDVITPRDLEMKLHCGHCELDPNTILTAPPRETILVDVSLIPTARMIASRHYAGSIDLRDAAGSLQGVFSLIVSRVGR